MNAFKSRAFIAFERKFVVRLLILPLLFTVMSGCGGQKDFDPKALSGGDSPEMQQANRSMEDFMKTQGKPKAK